MCVCVCGGGGVLAPRSQESCLRHSQLWSRHSQPQSAYLSVVRACVHVNTSNATAKFQIARGFHVHTTHCQHICQKNTDFTKNPGFSSKCCILMVLRFPTFATFFGTSNRRTCGHQTAPKSSFDPNRPGTSQSWLQIALIASKMVWIRFRNTFHNHQTVKTHGNP